MFTLNCNKQLLVVDKPLVMGIINITPDSFYAGSRHLSEAAVIGQAGAMLAAGATILDIGGQSTRPGSERISSGDELNRVLPVIEAVHKTYPSAILSIDTFYSEVATKAVAAGASIVNDISGGAFDNDMLPEVAKLNCPYICMHIQGEPGTMQHNPHYEDITREVIDYFIRRIDACRQAGIKDIIIDPGFGFGKTIEHNFTLLKNLSLFKILGQPVLAGLSRKGSIYKTLGVTAAEALNGTTVVNTMALTNGANILRVHDVKEAVEAVTLFQKIYQ
jgi:dihydropteroate synthase